MTDTISILSELRSNYCCFYAVDEPYYHALSEAIRALSAYHNGHWVRVGKEFGFAFDNFYCSECNYFSGTKTTNYCPNCGADMRERSDNGQND